MKKDEEFKDDDKKKEKVIKDGIKGEDELKFAKEPADDKAADDPDEDDEPMKETVDPKLDHLSAFIDATVNKDDAAGSSNIAEYIRLKAKEQVAFILERDTSPDDEKEIDDEDKKDIEDYSHLLGNRAKKKQPLKKMKKVKEAAMEVENTKDEDDEDESEDYLSNRDKTKKPLKKMKKEVSEATLVRVLKEFMNDESPIRLKGDDVFVNDKLVGTLENDLSNADAGIVFHSADGKGGKDFDNIQELYQFLVKKFEVNPEGPLNNKDKE